ncbi:MAG: SpoIIE family protein phosphatase [Eubacterium sp.]|nr:SpoIIE family protein phosphatase [Eubacterium sp.]
MSEKNNKKKHRFSVGIKMYLFVVLTVLTVALGASLISYNINVNQIDDYFKGLTLSSARTFATFLDVDFFKELIETAESEEYQAIRDEAEENDDETAPREYLKSKGLWDRYVGQRDMLQSFLDNMDDITYLYVVKCGGVNDHLDMYLLDDYENAVYETGYYEEREEAFFGTDFSKEVEPTISVGDWGWLCSGFAPVYDENGEVVCQVGCDVGMDEIMSQRRTLLQYYIIGAIVFALIVLVLAVILVRRVVVKPLGAIKEKMSEFDPSARDSYEQAGVIEIEVKSNDEISDIYYGIREMQINIINYLNDISVMRSDKERRDAEIAVASGMQADMLPKNFDICSEVSLYACMTPAREMGGDFYDFFMIDDDHLGIVMADVSGKGVAAALFMVAAKELINLRTMNGGTPAEILFDVNNKLCSDNPSGLFVTAWFGIITLSSGEMISANAGHEYPVIMRRDDEYELIRSDNMPPLATVEGLKYENDIITLEKGDRIFLYTDGVPEAKSGSGERFGMGRMMEILNLNKTSDPETLLEKMDEGIVTFEGEIEPFDDITMLSMVWNGR